MFETFGVELNNADVDIIREIFLGIEGGALCNFGKSDDKDCSFAGIDDDILIKDTGVDTLIKLSSAPLVGGGLAPLVAVGHRARGESPSMEATAASTDTGEMSPEMRTHTETDSGSSRRGGNADSDEQTLLYWGWE